MASFTLALVFAAVAAWAAWTLARTGLPTEE